MFFIQAVVSLRRCTLAVKLPYPNPNTANDYVGWFSDNINIVWNDKNHVWNDKYHVWNDKYHV